MGNSTINQLWGDTMDRLMFGWEDNLRLVRVDDRPIYCVVCIVLLAGVIAGHCWTTRPTCSAIMSTWHYRSPVLECFGHVLNWIWVLVQWFSSKGMGLISLWNIKLSTSDAVDYCHARYKKSGACFKR
jgi:hypothetical protein